MCLRPAFPVHSAAYKARYFQRLSVNIETDLSVSTRDRRDFVAVSIATVLRRQDTEDRESAYSRWLNGSLH